MKTRDRIIAYIEKNGQASGKELADFLGITDRAVRKQLAALMQEKILIKRGKSPRVFYSFSATQERSSHIFDAEAGNILEKNFLYVSPQGDRIEGTEGFTLWCEKRGFDIGRKAIEYVEIYKKYENVKRDGLISGKQKMIDTFQEDLCLEDVFYADFYAWEVFGKTKLGQLLLYAKQSQDINLMKEVISSIEAIIQGYIKDQDIKAVAFIPPTVKRQTQFMKVFKESLTLSVPEIEIQKIQTEIVTPQKTLNKLSDRIENATSTMVIVNKKSYKNVLLIDGLSALVQH